MAKRFGDKKELVQEHNAAIAQINKIINSLGFSKEEIEQAKQELSKYMPKEVFLQKYGNQRGWSLLYAVYAPQIVNDFFKEERGVEKRQSPKSRRIQYEELAGDWMDYVQSVFMGYHSDDIFRGGVRSMAVAPEPAQSAVGKEGEEGYKPAKSATSNPYIYDPTQKDQRKSICPHCGVSFWPKSAGNCNPQYQMVDGKPLREWRETEAEAPEHIKFNPTTGERQEGTGYSYCGGHHQVYDVTTPDGNVDVEAAERLSGLGWDHLRDSDRIRTVAKEGALKHYLVDSYLGEVERLLGGKVAYMKFGDEWVYEKDGNLYRECRHPIALKSPASVIHDRIARYTFNISEKKSSGRARKIKVYMCPKCSGEFKDIEEITSKKGDKEPIVEVQCDECGYWFNIKDLSDDMIYTMQWISPQSSLNLSQQTEDGQVSELIDTLPGRDVGYLQLEMTEIFDLFQTELDSITRTLNIRGAEHAKEIFEDWIIGGLDLKEIMQKYFAGAYRLHFTECADCGYTMDEKSNPGEAAQESYDKGIPVVMTQCPRHSSDPRHKVEVPVVGPVSPSTISTPKVESTEEADPLEQFTVSELREEMSQARPEEAIQKQQKQKDSELIEDDNLRRKYLGTNLIYHGRPKPKSSLPGQSYQVTDIAQGIAQELPPTDPHTYKGEQGTITRLIYAPAQRLIKAVIDALKENPTIRDRYEDMLDTLDAWSKQFAETSIHSAKIRSFCKF